jgi:hypothetical protein
MDAFGIMGMGLGALGFIFALTAMQQIKNLERKLKQFDVIPEGFDSAQKPEKDQPD